jgi:hypothetical protein
MVACQSRSTSRYPMQTWQYTTSLVRYFLFLLGQFPSIAITKKVFRTERKDPIAHTYIHHDLLSISSIPSSSYIIYRRCGCPGLPPSSQFFRGGYSQGESCLFGGSNSRATNQVWLGRKVQAASPKTSDMPQAAASFIPSRKNFGSFFVPQK